MADSTTGFWGIISALTGGGLALGADALRRRWRRQDDEASEARLDRPIESYAKLTESQQNYNEHLLKELQDLQGLLILARDEIARLRAELMTAKEMSTSAHAELTLVRADLESARSEISDLRTHINGGAA